MRIQEPPHNVVKPLPWTQQRPLEGACLGIAEFGRLLRESQVHLDYGSPGTLHSALMTFRAYRGFSGFRA